MQKNNSGITIRTTTFADIPKLRTMHAQSWRDTYPSPENGVTKEWIQEWTTPWTSPEGIARSEEHFKTIFDQPDHLHQIAVTQEGDVVGMVHISRNENSQHLEALYVDAHYVGTGLAQQLMNRALAWADTSKKIYLEVVSYNERAKAFYRKYDFIEKPGSEAFFSDVIPIITMEREGQG